MAVWISGEITEREWTTLDMVLVVGALGTILTMAAAVMIDMMAPMCLRHARPGRVDAVRRASAGVI
ncbi:hypothetical protein [Ilumatobacter sp.]|uniref:hypothetical protein n=1 Tax=Ilumatobacter sp. TaxID=1967498 RepID=UPI003C64FA2B